MNLRIWVNIDSSETRKMYLLPARSPISPTDLRSFPRKKTNVRERFRVRPTPIEAQVFPFWDMDGGTAEAAVSEALLPAQPLRESHPATELWNNEEVVAYLDGPRAKGEVWIHIFDAFENALERIVVASPRHFEKTQLEIFGSRNWEFRTDTVFPRVLPPVGYRNTIPSVIARAVDTGNYRNFRDLSQAHGWAGCILPLTARNRRGRPATTSVESRKREIEGRNLLESEQKASETWLPAVYSFAQKAQLEPAGIFGENRSVAYYRSLVTPIPPRSTGHPHVQQIQEQVEQYWRNAPGVTPIQRDLSDAGLVHRLLSGMAPTPPRLFTVKGGQEELLVDFRWSKKDVKGPYAGTLPDLSIRMDAPPVSGRRTRWEPRWQRAPKLLSVEVEYPGSAPVVVRPVLGVDDRSCREPWAHAKRLVRQAVLLSGQIDWHVARAHFLIEGILGALRRTVPIESPITKLLWPFVRTVDEVNYFGDSLLFQEKSLLVSSTGLTNEGVSDRMAAQMGNVTWKNFQPRRPLYANDTFGIWSNITYVGIRNYVRRAVGSIEKSWRARDAKHLAAFSKLLRKKMLPFCSFMESGMRQPGGAWVDEAVEAMDGPRRGALGAGFDGIDNLKDFVNFATHVLWTVVFLHSYVGHAQFEDGADVLAAPLALKWRPNNDGTFAPEKSAAEYYWADSEDASFQLFLGELLSRSDWAGLGSQDFTAHHEYQELWHCISASLQSCPQSLDTSGFSLGDLGGRIHI